MLVDPLVNPPKNHDDHPPSCHNQITEAFAKDRWREPALVAGEFCYERFHLSAYEVSGCGVSSAITAATSSQPQDSSATLQFYRFWHSRSSSPMGAGPFQR